MSSNATNKYFMVAKSTFQVGTEDSSTSVSPRDDGYQSKAGESITEDLSFLSDARSVDADSIMQITPRSAKVNEGEREQKKASDSIPVIVYPKNDETNQRKEEDGVSSDDCSCFSSKEWNEIHKVVERFSQSTITLLSWIDELEDISLDEITSSCFYNSQAERKGTAKRHVERLCEDVKEDAAILLRNLASERSTILAVLRKVELQCRRFGISVGDDIADLSNIMPFKKALKSGLAPSKLQVDLTAPLASYEEFKPLLTSTPRNSPMSKTPLSNPVPNPCKEDIIERKIPDSWECIPTFQSSLLPERIMNRRERTIQFSSFTLRRNWVEFLNDSSAVQEWLKDMEMRVRQAEISDLSKCEIEVLFEKYWYQFIAKKAKFHSLKIKANYVRTMFPELEQDVQNKMFETDRLWQALVMKICRHLAPLSRMYGSIEAYPPPPYRPRESELSVLTDAPYARPLTVEEWRQCRPFLGPDVQLSDFSFRQIRDRVDIDLESCFCRPLTQYRHLGPAIHSADWLERNEREVWELPWELEYPDTSSVRTCDDESRSWVEFEGLEEEILPRYRPLERWSEVYDSLHRVHRDPKLALTEQSGQKRARIGSQFQRRGSSDLKRNNYSSSPWMVPKTSSKVHFYDTRDKESDLGKLSKSKDNENGNIKSDEPECSCLSGNPYLLSSRIKEFHHWLKEIEEEAYKKTGTTIGWDPQRLYELLQANRHQLLSLQYRKLSLIRILSSSDNIMESHARDVSEFFLLWSTWMLEQRYFNLLLYSIDMECILERRLEILERGTIRFHPHDGAWNDRGVDMVPTVQTTDEDYLIFFRM